MSLEKTKAMSFEDLVYLGKEAGSVLGVNFVDDYKLLKLGLTVMGVKFKRPPIEGLPEGEALLIVDHKRSYSENICSWGRYRLVV